MIRIMILTSYNNGLINGKWSLILIQLTSPNRSQLIFNGIAVAKENDQKHLCLILDSKLSFEKHLNEKIIKSKKHVGELKHLSKFLPLKTLLASAITPPPPPPYLHTPPLFVIRWFLSFLIVYYFILLRVFVFKVML